MRNLFGACAVLLLQLGTAAAQPDPPPPPSGAVVKTWNLLAIDTVRIKSQSDAQAARVYAMMNAAMYDGVWGIRSHFKGARGMALVSTSGAPSNANLAAAAVTAAHGVLVALFPDQKPRYDTQKAADLAAIGGGTQSNNGQLWGNNVASSIVAMRAGDGSSPAESQPAGSGPGVFRASWSGVQFRNLAPFAIADSSVYVVGGPPPLGSLDYAAALNEVKVLGNAAIADSGKLNQFQFWNLSTGTSQPPGAWLQIAIELTNASPLLITDMTRLFALVSLAMADTVAPTYTTKFNHRFWRPTTAIREADTDGNADTVQDAAWSARAGAVGSSPESWSGHSSFSAAAAQALRGFYCSDSIGFSFASDSAPGALRRSYASFTAAEAEAGRSRIVGGIHFEFSNQAGLAAGRAIAAEVLASKLLLNIGETHFGDCPR